MNVGKFCQNSSEQVNVRGLRTRSKWFKKIDETGKINKDSMDPKWKQLQTSKHKKWISTLTATYIYIYTTTDKSSGDINSNNNEVVGLNFPSLKRINDKMSQTKHILLITLNAGNLSLT